jgi:predicted metal-binding membrane protein
MMSIGCMVAVGIAIMVEKTTPVGIAASRVAAGALAIGAVAWAT